jgi:hypothetical protein
MFNAKMVLSMIALPPFLVASPRPYLLPLPPPKATTITSVAASFASTAYNQEVLFSPTIIATYDHAI